MEDQNSAEQRQRRRKQHAHGGAPEQKAELRVRLAKEFAENARQTIKADEQAGGQSRLAKSTASHGEKQDQTKGQSLQSRLVKLARMARLRPGAGKDHRPRNIGRTAPQLRLDEIGDAHQKQPDRRHGAANIGDRPERNFYAA